MKVFLSHPMRGLTEKEVEEMRNDAITTLRQILGEDMEVIDNYHHQDVPEDAGRLWHLGRSIQQLETSDLVYFCPGWQKAKGCRIEHQIAKMYGVPILSFE